MTPLAYCALSLAAAAALTLVALIIAAGVLNGLLLAWGLARVSADIEPVIEDEMEYDNGR